MIELAKLLSVGFAFGASVAFGAYVTMRLLRRREKLICGGGPSPEVVVRLQREIDPNACRLS
ncbi:hypothetical protein [Bradyrhizobium sp. 18]|uniref:hypothetical protein n=1 Tax=Bradyrhizobium sp. 18 TaxID=2782657 RepID=UPI001FF77DC8|nr:hypothetical protein [Bradyrhizobium sp. 18]MCK1503856.1 hypothetical protein [Bradyrhizobium sp. 18]